MKLSKDQRSALNKVRRWTWDPSKPELAIGGLAGTGKTTIVGALQRQRWLADVSITYLAPTGKAAQALRRKGLPAQTIHSFMYKFAGWRFNDFKGVHDPSFKWREPDHDGGLIVVDEASMVSGRIADELRDSGARILWVGDHGQLPLGSARTDGKREEGHRRARTDRRRPESELEPAGRHSRPPSERQPERGAVRGDLRSKERRRGHHAR